MAAAELDAEAAAEGPAPTISRLFGNHLLDWCEGRMSAARLQYLAQCGVDDGFAHPMIARLSHIQRDQNARPARPERNQPNRPERV